MSTKTDLEKAAREFAELEFLRTHESSISPITIGFNNLRPDKVFTYAAIKGFKAGYEHATRPRQDQESEHDKAN